MELLSALVRGLSEYPRLLEAARQRTTAAVYGASPIHRAHLAAALCGDLPGREFALFYLPSSPWKGLRMPKHFSGQSCR